MDYFTNVMNCFLFFVLLRLLYGILSRASCSSMLSGSCIGTFLLRMSDSMLGCIAVGFVDAQQQIQHTLIDTRG
jgi:hypothetical protein